MEFRSPKSRLDKTKRRPERLLGDETHFWKSLLDNPRLTGAVAPSGPFLARAMARATGGVGEGLVVELGPGTGPVTKVRGDRPAARGTVSCVTTTAIRCRPVRQRRFEGTSPRLGAQSCRLLRFNSSRAVRVPPRASTTAGSGSQHAFGDIAS